MLGIPFLDNNTSYVFSKFLSVFIQAGIPVFTLLSATVLFADFKAWHPQKWWTCLIKGLTNCIIFGLALFCVIYAIDGRYTETEIGDHGQTSYYYFGKAKNGVRFGFGKLFNADKIISVISDARGERTYENVKGYTVIDGKPYLSFEGTLVDRKKEGYGKSYKMVNGMMKVIYDGYYHNDLRCGEGTEYSYYESTGRLREKYIGEQLDNKYNGNGKRWRFGENGELNEYHSGGWAEDKYWGYGVNIEFKDNKINNSYRGTYWDGKIWGNGILEYADENNTLIVWVGYSTEEGQGNGAYYNSQKEFWPSLDNGSYIEGADGSLVMVEERVTELENKWPCPDDILYGNSAEEYLKMADLDEI